MVRGNRETASAERSKWQLALHVVIAAVVWGLFAWAWYVVFLKRTNDQTLNGVLALGAFLLIMLLVTLGWVRHNLRIYERRGPRTQVPTVREDWSRDVLGRTVEADWAAVRSASVVVIETEESVKRYVVGDVDAKLEPVNRA